MIPTKKQWKDWSLPSKLTAIGTFVGVLSFGAYVIEKGYGISKLYYKKTKELEDVNVVFKFRNDSTERVILYLRGEVFYWYPGPGGYHETYTFQILEPINNSEQNGTLVIAAKSNLKVVAKLFPTEIARRYLEQGHMSISFYFKGRKINQFSPSIAFSKESLKNAYIPIILETKI